MEFSKFVSVCSIFVIMISLFQPIVGRESSERYQQSIAGISKPRKIILAKEASSEIVFSFCFLLIWNSVLGFEAYDELAHAHFAGFFFVAAMIAVFDGACLWEIRTELLNRKLLQDGEFCLGVITSQRKAGRHRNRSVVEYSFSDKSGRARVGSGTDLTRLYFENMPVPVFYDSDHPSRNIAGCCTRWRICAKDGFILEP